MSGAVAGQTGDEIGWIGLREFVRRAEAIGEVEHVTGAHWDREMSTISHALCHGPRDPKPALLFDGIPDYPAGYRTLYGLTNSRNRIALAVGMEPTYATDLDFLRDYREKRREIENVDAIDPEVVDPASATVMENVQRGDDVNLFSFPVPLHHEGDGGRYIGTACCFISDSPETGRVNLGAYRMQAFDAGRCGVYISPGKHGGIDVEDYWERGERMPVAASFGQDPVLYMYASVGVEHTHPMGEYAHTGGLKGRPYPVVEGPVTGLPLPADAEIAIEGWIEPGATEAEGPFGEWQGYYGRDADEEPVIDVAAVYHRDDPILTCAVPAKPPFDYSYQTAASRAAYLWEQLEAVGIPGIVGVWRPEFGGSRLVNVVSIEQRYPGHARQVGVAASQVRAGGYCNRWTIVVDDDIDPTNWPEVAWAMSTRCDPAGDIETFRRSWSTPLDTMVEKGGTAPGKKDLSFNSRAVVDATVPYERRETFPKVTEAPPAYAREIREKWRDVIGGTQ